MHGKSIESYNTPIGQSQKRAPNNLEVADSVCEYKWQLNQCKKSLKDSLALRKHWDKNVVVNVSLMMFPFTLASNPTFQICLRTLRWKEIFLLMKN